MSCIVFVQDAALFSRRNKCGLQIVSCRKGLTVFCMASRMKLELLDGRKYRKVSASLDILTELPVDVTPMSMGRSMFILSFFSVWAHPTNTVES